MSARTLTYLALLTSMQNAVGLSAASLSATQKASFADFLTESSRWAWRKNKDRPWPEAVVHLSVVPTSGVVTWSQIAYAENVRFWSADPRPTTTPAYMIDATHDQDGFHLKADVSPVWAEYLPRPPEFTSVNVVAATQYAVDALVFDGTDGTITATATGQCYRCIVANSLGTAIADTSKWELQTVLKILESAIKFDAASQYFTSLSSDARAAGARERAIDNIEDEWTKAFPRNATYSHPPLGWR